MRIYIHYFSHRKDWFVVGGVPVGDDDFPFSGFRCFNGGQEVEFAIFSLYEIECHKGIGFGLGAAEREGHWMPTEAVSYMKEFVERRPNVTLDANASNILKNKGK